jgi:AcrR family transcriptional regulator
MDTSPLSRHDRRRQQTRKLLIQTTLQLVLEKGYDAVSIQNITDQADLGRGTFYIHFKDKEEVIWAMVHDLFQEMEQSAHQQLDRTIPQVEYFGLLNIFQHAEQNRDLYRMIFGGQGPAVLKDRVQDLMARSFLYDIQNSPHPPEVNFNLPEEFEAQILTGMISRLLFWWLNSPNDYTAGQMASMAYKALYRKLPPVEDGS